MSFEQVVQEVWKFNVWGCYMGSLPVTVVLRVPENHTMDIPDGMSELLMDLCQRAGYEGEIEARLSRRRSGSAHCQGIQVGQVIGDNAVVVHAQPGDNSTFHDVLLMCPAGARNVREFWLKLHRATETWGSGVKRSRRERTLRRMRIILRRFGVGNLLLNQLDKACARECGFQTVADLRELVKTEAAHRDGVLHGLGGSHHEFLWSSEFVTSVFGTGEATVADPVKPEALDDTPLEPLTVEEQVRLGLLGESDATRLLDLACEKEKEAGQQQDSITTLEVSVAANSAELDLLTPRIKELEQQLTAARAERNQLMREINRDQLLAAQAHEVVKQARNVANVYFDQAQLIGDAVNVLAAVDQVEDTLETLPPDLRQLVLNQVAYEEPLNNKEE